MESIALALGLNAVYFPGSRLKGRDMGEAILSPWPIEKSCKVLLPYETFVVGKGADAFVFLRNSNYSYEGFEDIRPRNPQVRVYLSWNSVR